MIKLLVINLFLLPLNLYALSSGVEVADSDPISKSVIALQMSEKQDDGTIRFYKGSGVLIDRNIILTAAHNFAYLTDVTTSQAIFSTVPAWGSDSFGQKRILVKSVTIHPDFYQGQLGTGYDIALVFLNEGAPSEYVPLEIELNGTESPVINEEGILLGYGRTSADTAVPLSDYRLRRLDLKFARWDDKSIFDSQKIWFSNQKGSIEGGDSGGPVLFKRNNVYKVFGIGIHQRYDSCVDQKSCEPQSAYSNTTYFAEWIRAALKR